jgi:hypothetical protein
MSVLARAVPLGVMAMLLVGGVALDRDLPPPPAVEFGTATTPPMPVVETGVPLSSSWYCPGAPAASDPAGGTGVVSVLNPGDTAIDGTITIYPSEGAPKSQPLAVGGRSRVDVRLSDVAVSPWAAAIVELIGAEGVVE